MVESIFPSQYTATRAIGLLAVSKGLVDHYPVWRGKTENWENNFASNRIRPHLAELSSKINFDITFTPFIDCGGESYFYALRIYG